METDTKKTNLVLKVQKPSSVNSDEGSRCSKYIDEALTTIKNELLSVVKIITMGVISDEDSSVDFLSEYENYKKLHGILVRCEITDDKVKDEHNFAKNVFRCWMDVLSSSIIALHALPNNTLFHCEVIGENDNEITTNTTKDTSKSIGFCYCASFNIEAFDWKEHTVELFIPIDDSKKLNSLYTVDGEVVLAS